MRHGRFGQEKILFPLMRLEPRPLSCAASSPVTTHIALSRLLHCEHIVFLTRYHSHCSVVTSCNRQYSTCHTSLHHKPYNETRKCATVSSLYPISVTRPGSSPVLGIRWKRTSENLCVCACETCTLSCSYIRSGGSDPSSQSAKTERPAYRLNQSFQTKRYQLRNLVPWSLNSKLET